MILAVARNLSSRTLDSGFARNLVAGALPVLALAFCLSLAALVFGGNTHAQDDESLPLVSLESLSPSPVREGTGLTIVARITPPLPAATSTVIRSGVRVFDSWIGPQPDQLIALVFRGGQPTRTVAFEVVDDGVTTTDRTICVDIHAGWDDNNPGEPRAMVVRVFDKDVANPPADTPPLVRVSATASTILP